MRLSRLYPAQKSVLEQALKSKETEADVVKKINIFLFCWENRSDESCFAQAAKAFKVHLSTVYKFINLYQKFGYRKLLEPRKHQSERHPVYNDLEKIEALIEASNPKSQKEILTLIEENLEYCISLKTLRKVLSMLEIKKRKPKIIPGKCDPAKQEAFLNDVLLPVLEEAKETGSDINVCFMDAAHLNNGGDAQAVYSKDRIAIPSPADRESASIIGAMDPINEKYLMMQVEDNVNKEMIVKFLQKLRYQYGDKKRKIFVELDNARYQKSKIVFTIAKKLNIELIFYHRTRPI